MQEQPENQLENEDLHCLALMFARNCNETSDARSGRPLCLYTVDSQAAELSMSPRIFYIKMLLTSLQTRDQWYQQHQELSEGAMAQWKV
jgi:hypothetical protein